MADVKISALPLASTPLAGTEVLPIVQSATTDQVSVANLTAGRAVSAASLTLTGTPLAVGSGGTGLSTLTAANYALYSTSSSALTAGTLPVAAGGTGLTSLTAGYIPYGNGTGAFSSSANLVYGGGTFAISGSAQRLLSVYATVDRADIAFVSGSTKALRIGATSTSATVEAVDYTGSASYEPISLGGSQVLFTTSATERMRIASDGSVGIGTTSPSGKFTVSGGRSHFVAASDAFAISVGYASIGAYYLGANSANNSLLISNSGGTTVATFDNAGNLGLGVTPSAWTSPYYTALQIAGNGASISSYTSSLTSGKTIFVNSNCYTAYSAGNVWKYVGNGYASQYQQIDGAHAWLTAPSGTAGNAITFTQAMTLDASGLLALGQTSASFIFDAYSPASVASSQCRLRIKGTTNYSVLHVENTGGVFWAGLENSTGGALFSGTAAYSGVVGTSGAYPLALCTNGTERIRVDTSGVVTIKNGTAPGSNPSGGGYLYVENGALKYRGSSGTVTTLGAA